MLMRANPALKAFIFTGMFSIAGVAFNVIPDFIYHISVLFFLSVLLFLLKRLFLSYFLFCACTGLLISIPLNDFYDLPPKSMPAVAGIFKGEIKEILKESGEKVNFTAAGILHTRHLKTPLKTDILFRVKGKVTGQDYRPGQRILTKVHLRPPAAPGVVSDFNESHYLKSVGCDFLNISRGGKIRFLPSGKSYLSIMHDLRKSVNAESDKLFSPANAGIIKALTVADRSDVNYESDVMFARSGTSHLLSVSGLHVGIFAMMVYSCLAFMKKRAWLKFVIFFSIMFLYVTVTGFQPPAVRAFLMAVLILYIRTRERRIQPFNVLAIAVVIALVADPLQAYSIGFQLSVLAVAGIIAFYPKIHDVLSTANKGQNPLLRFIFASLAMSISATLLSAPLAAWYFGIYSLVSPLSNLFMVPLMSLALVMAAFALMFSFLPPIAGLFAHAAEMCLDASTAIGNLSAAYEWSYIDSPAYSITVALCISCSLIYILWSKNKKQALFRLSASLLLCILVVNISAPSPESSTVYVPFDDHVYIESKLADGKDILVLIIDRRPHIKPRSLNSLKNYLAAKKEKPLICINGNLGSSLSDELGKVRRFELRELTLKQQEYLRKELGFHEKLPQIIDYANN